MGISPHQILSPAPEGCLPDVIFRFHYGGRGRPHRKNGAVPSAKIQGHICAPAFTQSYRFTSNLYPMPQTVVKAHFS